MSGSNLFLEQRLTEIDQWLDMLHSQRYVSEHTLEAYQRDLHKLARFLAKEGCQEWAELDQARLTHFIGLCCLLTVCYQLVYSVCYRPLEGFTTGSVSNNS